ncbi:MAG: TIGR00730 family Rossman fold protein [Pseudomonadota bacterium]
MRICVFCGSSDGRHERYREAGRALGSMLAKAGIGVVYGGATIGVMGAVADGALAEGGEVIGVIPEAMMTVEIAHHRTDLRVVGTMHERKALMAELSDAFIALPGGIGTMEEVFEVWTWAQLGYHGKPVSLLDIDGYWDALHRFVDHMVHEGFLRAAHREMLIIEDDASTLLERLKQYQPPKVDKLLRSEER